MKLVDADSDVVIARIVTPDFKEVTISTTTASEEVLLQVDYIRLDGSCDTQYVKATNKNNIYMNKKIREKSNRE